MGQAWCKEKSEKAQDSKSPLDRVFVRCAHRIYPGLKEDGSVLGGATQRVTSSEIGYAGSPPRAALLRGQSIDSVDRPFHPSEWVDVNLEVPCTPRASVVLTSAHQQRSSNLAQSNDRRSQAQNGASTTTASGAPVPPPRRRRRRERRPLPPKPGSGDDESEPEPHYTQLRSPSAATTSGRSEEDLDVAEGPSVDSEDEFVAIERILKKCSLEEISSAHLPNLKSTARPKNHSTTSLPNVAELLVEKNDEGVRSEEEVAAAAAAAVATRPPRHAKTASLPRDASLDAPQTPERTFFSRWLEEDRGDNSIFKIDASPGRCSDGEVGAATPDCSSLVGFETDVKTSTPVKEPDSAAHRREGEEAAGPSRSCQNIDDAFHSCRDASSASGDSSSVAGANHQVDRPPAEAATGNNEDAGYESRSGSHLLYSDGSSASARELAHDEMSSGILRDAGVDSEDLGIPADAANDSAVAVVVQRTISEESLPREMLDDVDDVDDEINEPDDREKSAKDASNELTRQTSANDSENFATPPPSPEFEASSTDVQPSRPAKKPSKESTPAPSSPTKSQQQRSGPSAASAVASNGLTTEADDNPTSMTPSLMELEAALSDMLERKDEEERRASEESGRRLLLLQQPEEEVEEDKSSDKSPEPQIVPVKRNRALEDGDIRRVSPPQSAPTKMQPSGEEEEKEEEERSQPAKSRLIDFQRPDRTNPFNDSKTSELQLEFSPPTDEPPEKPSRLHRVSLIEESIDEPLIVPTPPRRRHRSKSNLNSSNESTAEVFRRCTYNDRLI